MFTESVIQDIERALEIASPLDAALYQRVDAIKDEIKRLKKPKRSKRIPKRADTTTAPNLLTAAARLHDAALMVEILVYEYANKDSAVELSAAMKETRELIEAVRTAAQENTSRDEKPMKVKHLLAKLLQQDPEARVTVPVQTFTQAYPAGYFTPSNIEKAWDDTIRLWTHLPEGYTISHRRTKPD